MSESNWRLGRILNHDDVLNLEHAVLVAEVYSGALQSDDGGLVASYLLVDGLVPAEADRAMNFFCNQASLLVDVQGLVEDSGAEFPALVTIRYSDDAPGYFETVTQHDILRQLPSNEVISRDGWDIFCAYDALMSGRAVDEAEPLGGYGQRELRQKIFANRALTQEDRDPWLLQERDILRTLTSDNPDGAEVFKEIISDIEAALDGTFDVGDRFAVVIPTRIERGVQDGAMYDWIPQIGREIVVAHGLDAIQAARALVVVGKNPEAFVELKGLMREKHSRETLGLPFIVPDSGINWISTDLGGRRSQSGYARLQEMLNVMGQSNDRQPMQIPSQGAQR